MTGRNRFYVSRDGSDWIVTKHGEAAVLGRFKSQPAAVQGAKGLATVARPSHVLVQKPIHTFELEAVFHADRRSPFPPSSSD